LAKVEEEIHNFVTKKQFRPIEVDSLLQIHQSSYRYDSSYAHQIHIHMPLQQRAILTSPISSRGTRTKRLLAALRSGPQVKLPLSASPQFPLYTYTDDDTTAAGYDDALPYRTAFDVKEFYASHRSTDLSDSLYAERLVKVYHYAITRDSSIMQI
jgi:hypothetical protein